MLAFSVLVASIATTRTEWRSHWRSCVSIPTQWALLRGHPELGMKAA